MILPLEQQYASPELCKRLVELGAPTGTSRAYRRSKNYATDPGPWEITYRSGLSWGDTIISDLAGIGRECWPAYSVAELGELLRRKEFQTMPTPWDNGEWKGWQWHEEERGLAFGTVETEADARAELLIYLLTNKLLTFEEPHHA